MNKKYVNSILSVSLLAISVIPFVDASGRNNELRSKILQGRKEQKEIKTTIDEANNKAGDVIKEIKAELAKIKKVTDEQKPLQDKWVKAIKNFEESEKKLAKHLTTMYVNGGTNLMVQLLSVDNLEEFLASLHVGRNFVAIDKEICEDYRAKADAVKQSKAVYDDKIAEIEKEIEKSREKEKEIMDGIKDNRKRLEALQLFEKAHEEEVIELTGEMLRAGDYHCDLKFASPVHNYRVSSPFGPRWGKLHKGTDFQPSSGGALGEPVYAPAFGLIVEVKLAGNYGMLITCYHGRDSKGRPVLTRYAHSYPHQIKVHPGQLVKKGQQPTSIGNMGHSTGPHLHFEVLIGGNFVNPMKYVK